MILRGETMPGTEDRASRGFCDQLLEGRFVVRGEVGFPGQRSSPCRLATIWLPPDAPGYRLVLARGWHDHQRVTFSIPGTSSLHK